MDTLHLQAGNRPRKTGTQLTSSFVTQALNSCSFTPSSHPPARITTPGSLFPLDLAQDHRSWDGATHIQSGLVFPPQLDLSGNIRHTHSHNVLPRWF